MAYTFQHDKKLHFQFEVLRARLAIRELFLKTTVQEVYENIGQVLSVVRMQLHNLVPEKSGALSKNLIQPGNLVGQTIRDLRHMCRNFYPDEEILKDGGFIEGIKENVKLIGLEMVGNIEISGHQLSMSDGISLIVFNILQDIFISIKQIEADLKSIQIHYHKNEITFKINYLGKELEWEKAGLDNNNDESLNIKDRLQLIGGNLKVDKSKPGNLIIKLTSPVNNTTYE